MHVTAEKCRMEVNNQVDEMKLVHEEKLKNLRENSNTRRKQVELDNEIKIREKEASVLKQETEIDKKKIQVNKELTDLETD